MTRLLYWAFPVLLGWCLMFMAVSLGLAHDHGKVTQWLQQQKIPEGNGALSGFGCCNDQDVEEVEEDIREGEYWIKGGHFPEWKRVPPSLVIKEPNKHGQPVVWWVRGETEGYYDIRCYAPGGGV